MTLGTSHYEVLRNSSVHNSAAIFVASCDILFNLTLTSRVLSFLLNKETCSDLAKLVSKLSLDYTVPSTLDSDTFCAATLR